MVGGDAHELNLGGSKVQPTQVAAMALCLNKPELSHVTRLVLSGVFLLSQLAVRRACLLVQIATQSSCVEGSCPDVGQKKSREQCLAQHKDTSEWLSVRVH